MILGIGTDIIEINRFSLWYTYSRKKLRRIFSDEEIDYCLSDSTKSAERFAARFAAREALYKALSIAYPDIKIPFLTLCSSIIIRKNNNRPYIMFKNIIIDHSFHIHLSFAHSHTIASAFIILEEI